MAHPYKSAAHKSDPKWLDGVRKYADGGDVEPRSNDEPVFSIPSRDFSKEPASVGEMAATTAKMMAEPYARTIRNAYRTLTKGK